MLEQHQLLLVVPFKDLKSIILFLSLNVNVNFGEVLVNKITA